MSFTEDIGEVLAACSSPAPVSPMYFGQLARLFVGNG